MLGKNNLQPSLYLLSQDKEGMLVRTKGHYGFLLIRGTAQTGERRERSEELMGPPPRGQLNDGYKVRLIFPMRELNVVHENDLAGLDSLSS